MQSDATGSSTRDRLLLAAAQLLDEAGGDDVSTRAICDRAGVSAPTLYHHFGNKQGLVDAVLDHGFTRYTAAGTPGGDTDPIDAVRAGWDAHVRFGLEQPTFYVLLYGRVRPGIPCGVTGPATTMLTGLLDTAARSGRLRVPPAEAAAQILAANVGATLGLRRCSASSSTGSRDRYHHRQRRGSSRRRTKAAARVETVGHMTPPIANAAAASPVIRIVRAIAPAFSLFLVLHAVLRVADIDLPWWQRVLIGLPLVVLIERGLDRLADRTGPSLGARAARRTVRIVVLGVASRRRDPVA